MLLGCRCRVRWFLVFADLLSDVRSTKGMPDADHDVFTKESMSSFANLVEGHLS